MRPGSPAAFRGTITLPPFDLRFLARHPRSTDNCMPDVAKNIASEILKARRFLIWVGAGTSFPAAIPTDRC